MEASCYEHNRENKVTLPSVGGGSPLMDAKAIGVCNFDIECLERLLNEYEVIPVVNQVE